MEKKRILIVDDEVPFTQLLKLVLEKDGRYVVQVENQGIMALASAREFRPDMIFMDVIMPDIEGSRVASMIRSDEELRSIPIVFLTAVVSKEEAGATGGLIGGFPFMAKPVTAADLINRIESTLNG